MVSMSRLHCLLCLNCSCLPCLNCLLCLSGLVSMVSRLSCLLSTIPIASHQINLHSYQVAHYLFNLVSPSSSLYGPQRWRVSRVKADDHRTVNRHRGTWRFLIIIIIIEVTTVEKMGSSWVDVLHG